MVRYWEYDQLEDQTMAGEMTLWDDRGARWTRTAKARESWSTLTEGYFLCCGGSQPKIEENKIQ